MTSGPDAPSGSLFPESEPAARRAVGAAAIDEATRMLAGSLADGLRLGTSSWNFPGWRGLVWDDDYPEKRLSREGITAYAEHPLFQTVSLDRAFYRPLSEAQYAAYARAVPAGFRYVVKAPAQITDALIRGAKGQPQRDNPDFMNADQAARLLVEPAMAGLGARLGALVFQFSPLSAGRRNAIQETIAALHDLLSDGARRRGRAGDFTIAVEVRDPEWLTPDFVAALADTDTTYCLGLHPRLPAITDQLPILRRLWPGPFVCRWNLNMKHGAQGYERARRDYAPFDRLIDPDTATRDAIARVAAGTAHAGQPVFITINNKAEGSAPCSVRALAERIAACDTTRR